MASTENSPQKSSPSFPEEETEAMDEDGDSTPVLEGYESGVVVHDTGQDDCDMDHEEDEDMDSLFTSPLKGVSDMAYGNEMGIDLSANRQVNGLLTMGEEGPISTHVNNTERKRAPTAADKKIHWTGRQVSALLDSVECRLEQFRNRGVHANVWQEIGEEMAAIAPPITTKHCYNKWKNLRRDVRISLENPLKPVRNPGNLSRVAHLVTEIYPNADLALGHVTDKKARIKVGASGKPNKGQHSSPNVKSQVKQEAMVLQPQPAHTEENNNGAVSPTLPTDLSYQTMVAALNDLHHNHHQPHGVPPSLFPGPLPSLLVNPAFLMQSQILSSLINQQQQQTSNTNGSEGTINALTPSSPPCGLSPVDLTSTYASPKRHTEQDLGAFRAEHPTSLNGLSQTTMNAHHDASGTTNAGNSTISAIHNDLEVRQQDLIDILNNFYAEEKQHFTVIERVSELIYELKMAAQRRMSTLDHLLKAFSG